MPQTYNSQLHNSHLHQQQSGTGKSPIELRICTLVYQAQLYQFTVMISSVNAVQTTVLHHMCSVIQAYIYVFCNILFRRAKSEGLSRIRSKDPSPAAIKREPLTLSSLRAAAGNNTSTGKGPSIFNTLHLTDQI